MKILGNMYLYIISVSKKIIEYFFKNLEMYIKIYFFLYHWH